MTERKLPSLAKLTQPSSAGVFPRHRLFRLIDQKRSHPVLWIAGPPGSGKTTLVASYLAARRFPCLWYQVDERDGDIATFFYYMGLATKKATPRKKQPLPLFTPEYLQDIPTFTRRYFERLYGQLVPSRPLSSGGKNGGITLVFDNYQDAPEGSLFHEVIHQCLSEIPAGVNVVLISRQDPPSLFARMRANRHMGTIGWNELRFNLGESQQMIRHRGYKRISSDLFRQLYDRTEGWAAGLVLLTEGLKAGGSEPLSTKARIPEEVFHYFAAEVLNETDWEKQVFLLKTAFLSRMTPSMAEALTGLSEARRILSDLNQKNYFTQRHEAQTTFYQYHPLFREFLQAQGKERFGSDELLQIEQRAAGILEANGQVEDAVELLAKAGDWSNLVRLILARGPALISQGRNQTLEAWIRYLPRSLLEENPWLLYWLGVCRLPFSPPESEGSFEKAFNSFRARRDAAGVFLSLSGLFDSTTYGMGDFRDYDRWIDLLRQVGGEYTAFPSEEVEARLTASVTFAIIARQPEHPKFDEWVERALVLVERSPDLFVKTRTLQALASHYIFAGDLLKAALVIDSFQEVAQSPHLPPLLVILLKNLEAMYFWMSGSFEDCRRTAAQGIKLASSTGVHLWDTYLLGHAAAGALSTGDMTEARELLQKNVLLPGHDAHLGKRVLPCARGMGFLRSRGPRGRSIAYRIVSDPFG